MPKDTGKSKLVRRALGSALSNLKDFDLATKRESLRKELAPLGRAHMTAEALLRQLDALSQSNISHLASEDDPGGVKALKSLTGALKDVASTMALLRQEVREHVAHAMSQTLPDREDQDELREDDEVLPSKD